MNRRSAGKAMLPPKVNDGHILISGVYCQSSQHEMNDGFFPSFEVSTPWRGRVLRKSALRSKSSRAWRGNPTTQDVLLSSVSPQALRHIVYSWKDPSTVSLETMALTHKYVRIARLDAGAKLIIILRSSREKSRGKVRKIKTIVYYYHVSRRRYVIRIFETYFTLNKIWDPYYEINENNVIRYEWIMNRI